jgi:hypothetical protein
MAERTDEGKLARRRAVRPAVLMSAMMLRSICKLKVDVIDILCCRLYYSCFFFVAGLIDIDAHLSFAIGVVLN